MYNVYIISKYVYILLYIIILLFILSIFSIYYKCYFNYLFVSNMCGQTLIYMFTLILNIIIHIYSAL